MPAAKHENRRQSQRHVNDDVENDVAQHVAVPLPRPPVQQNADRIAGSECEFEIPGIEGAVSNHRDDEEEDAAHYRLANRRSRYNSRMEI